MATSHRHEMDIPVLVPSAGYCAGCVDRLVAAVRDIDGVESAEADRRSSRVVVVHDPTRITADRVEVEVGRLGFELGRAVAHAAYRLTGLD